MKKVERSGLKSIKASRIVVPFFKSVLSECARKHLENAARSHRKDPNGPFIFANLYDLNRSIQKENPEETLITWMDIIHQHFPKWIIVKSLGQYEKTTRERVNEWIGEYFTYMPFVQQRLWSAVKVPFGSGFDKELEAKDYKINDYAMCRLKEQLKFEVIDKLCEIEIIDTK